MLCPAEGYFHLLLLFNCIHCEKAAMIQSGKYPRAGRNCWKIMIKINARNLHKLLQNSKNLTSNFFHKFHKFLISIISLLYHFITFFNQTKVSYPPVNISVHIKDFAFIYNIVQVAVYSVPYQIQHRLSPFAVQMEPMSQQWMA